MAWKIEFEPSAQKALRKLDRVWQRRIVSYLEDLASLPNPHVRGKVLTSDLSGLWRYRVGDYRILCQIEDDTLLIRIIKIGHRRNVYE